MFAAAIVAVSSSEVVAELLRKVRAAITIRSRESLWLLSVRNRKSSKLQTLTIEIQQKLLIQFMISNFWLCIETTFLQRSFESKAKLRNGKANDGGKYSNKLEKKAKRRAKKHVKGYCSL